MNKDIEIRITVQVKGLAIPASLSQKESSEYVLSIKINSCIVAKASKKQLFT